MSVPSGCQFMNQTNLFFILFIDENQPEVKYESKEDIPLATLKAENEEKKVLKYENGEILELKCADCNTPFPDGTKVKKNKKCENCNNQK